MPPKRVKKARKGGKQKKRGDSKRKPRGLGKSAKKRITKRTKRIRKIQPKRVTKKRVAPKKFKIVHPPNKIHVGKERLDKLEKAAELLGEARLKKGRHVIGGTGWINPDKRGLSRISQIAKKVTNAQIKKRNVYSFDLRITFYDKNGKPFFKVIPARGIPRIDSIKREYKANGRLETRIEAFERKIRRLVTHAIFEAFADVFPYPAKVRQGKVSERQARKIINQVKDARQTKIQFILYRETYR